MIVTVTLNPGPDRTLTVPKIRYGEVLRATSMALDWGGKGLNVSRTLRVLGGESVAVGFAGGYTGQMVLSGLAGLGIHTDFVPIAGETRTNTVVIESSTGRYIKVNEVGPTVRPAELAAFFTMATNRVTPGDIWVIGGRPPGGVPPETYPDLITRLQAAGARVFLDTSGEPLRLGCTAGPFLVKPNLSEATEMIAAGTEQQSPDADPPGVAAEVSDLAARAGALSQVLFFFGQGTELVALSMGGDGLLLASRSQAVWARPPHVPVRNPVGAGDALMAGLAWTLSRGASLEEMARWGVAAGTASVMHDRVGFDSREEVEALLPRVRLE